MSETQAYTYERDPSGQVHTFYRQGDGTYSARGRTLAIGTRRSYYDYSY